MHRELVERRRCAVVAVYFPHTPFPLLVLAAAAVGLAGTRFRPEALAAAPKAKGADAKTEGEGEVRGKMPLVIDDHAQPPAHTLPPSGAVENDVREVLTTGR